MTKNPEAILLMKRFLEIWKKYDFSVAASRRLSAILLKMDRLVRRDD